MTLVKNRGRGARGWVIMAMASAALAAPLAGCHRAGGQGGGESQYGQTQLSRDQARLIIKTLADAPTHGFPANAFPTDGLKAGDPRLVSEIIAYARAQHGLAIPKSAMDKSWGVRPPPYDAGAEFQAAVAQNRLGPWLASLPPQDPAYEQLRKGYLAYLKIASQNGGWPAVPDGPTLRPGSRDPRVAVLRQRLAFEDQAVAQGPKDGGYDAVLAGAVRGFQARHGLHVTGQVDADTLAALNVPAIARAAQIRANMERLRWHPRETPATRIDVNSAGQTFDLYIDGQPAMHMLTAAGKPGDETPIVVSKVHTVVLNPTWNVPPDIAANELLPKGEGYLQAHNFTTDGDKLVQQPGPDNSLGRVKFLFDNPYSIYMHDTPAKAAFTQNQRSVSHGCVRLQKAIDLAKLLLSRETTDWPPERVDETLSGTQTVNIPLKQSIPVRILYKTAFPEGDQISFRDDIYGWDQETLRALDQSLAGNV